MLTLLCDGYVIVMYFLLKLETIYQQKIDDLTELKKSILQKAFRGKL